MPIEPKHVAFAKKVLYAEIKQLRLRGAIRAGDQDDVASAVLVHLVEAWPAFDPDRAPVEAFITQVVATRLISVLRERNARKRRWGTRSIGTGGNEPVAPAWSDDRWTRLIDLRMDMDTALRRLSPTQRAICDQLLRDLLTHAAKEMGIPRRTLRDNVAKIRAILRDAGLEEYF
ncbi:MAG: sigma-70 family RNA polymerase sigma factor [Phycisphaeraceae bacterium]|nr:sigma-70 family RNA polymerase sigma factor [Phycisphaeraceae bacterium]